MTDDATPNDEAIAVLQRALKQRESDMQTLEVLNESDLRACMDAAKVLDAARERQRRTQKQIVRTRMALNSLKKAITDLGG